MKEQTGDEEDENGCSGFFEKEEIEGSHGYKVAVCCLGMSLGWKNGIYNGGDNGLSECYDWE